MDNIVIREVASSLTEHNIIAFRFNFRGIGKSQGRHDNGTGEIEDVRAAIDWLLTQPEVVKSKTGIAGYSFGASVALPEASADKRVKVLALISLALLNPTKMEQLRNYTMPRLVICGSADEYLTGELRAIMKQDSAKAMQFEVIPGADHFWFSFEPKMAEKVASFFTAKFAENV
jgi:alpha/beta superfamily hydrolase